MSRDNDDIAGPLGDQLARLFAKTVTREALVAAEHNVFDAALWNEISEIGAALALAAESVGGAGLAWAQADGLLQLLGSQLPPVPLGETMLAAWVLGLAGIEAPAAPLAVAGALLQIDGDGCVSGDDALVSWAPQAQVIVAVAQGAGARQLVLLSTLDAELTPQRTLDRLPAARARFRGARPLQAVAAPAVLGETGLLAPLAVLRALQLAGSLSQVLALCIDYANTRSQFGKTIGKFQAIQHQIAELAELSAAAQVAAGYAARQLDGGDAAAAERGAAVAKIRAAASATRGAAIAHQVFGAIGTTDEHLLHYHTRRLWQWRDEAGSDGWWAERLGRQALAAGAAALWTGITASAP
ncbi:MAG: acyl-CoA dehydrogenase [Hydrocarboniphaga sp.]|uniref:acyl-CoA dehydrogenase family protein n=1 Tax=Hydrocarboniphaga sp. TaxID=2033016 RepID=UPI002622C124|nr:acyl-CoA dehydrogenase family protein [Hydrocarboniphaga sp.]MDB5971403.1 acyl-CoA dehydrogenase [Hydrocarboniphaga sp.]